MKEIPLTQGEVAVVDDDDFQWLSQFKWHVERQGRMSYASRCPKYGKSPIYMHREILGAIPDDLVTDHKDCNGLNNRRSNLRLATRAQNVRNKRKLSNNTSGFKGVSWRGRDKRWRATIMVNYKHIELGLFKTKEDAAKAYRDAASRLHLEFARYE